MEDGAGWGIVRAMHREAMRAALDAAQEPWDVLVIGGGATGLGCALESATRGFRTVVLEQRDFASGSSSRSTKLFHGGVRYLRGGHFRMVAQSLDERARARSMAGALVRDTPFLVPVTTAWERFFYSAGLRVYDFLARDEKTPRSRTVSAAEARRLAPTLRPGGLRAGLVYHDYQFDDARFAIELARASSARGAVLLNYAPVTGFLYEGERVAGVIAHDLEQREELRVRARVVVNAAGVHADSVRGLRGAAAPLLRFSRGTHIVLDSSFLPGHTAVLVPRTDDDRVVFMIPWRGRVLIGTTDVPVDEPTPEPHATREEIDYLLAHAARYLSRAPSRADVRSAFAGLRPLPAVSGRSANVLRDHRVETAGGLVTICGGKWTTYRLMASDAIDAAARAGSLVARAPHAPAVLAQPPASNAALEARILDRMPLTADDVAEISRMCREEMACNLEDVLARRTRVLFLDADSAAKAAPPVAQALGLALGRDSAWIDVQAREFTALAKRYLPS
jgi:glycerol-3-phosphate dehydrogenase